MFSVPVEFIVILPLVVAFTVSWLIGIYSLFAMLPYVRGGFWAKIFILTNLPKPHGIDQYIEPNGIPHYRRLKKASVWFMTTSLCVFAALALDEFGVL